MKLTYWNTSCATYLIGIFVGLAIADLDSWWTLIPIFVGAISVSLYHYYILEQKLETIK